jgi:hypothetical protein
VRFEVLTGATMKITLFWDMALYIVADGYKDFIIMCCLHLQGRGEKNVLIQRIETHECLELPRELAVMFSHLSVQSSVSSM